jgi:hypothetical protein
MSFESFPPNNKFEQKEKLGEDTQLPTLSDDDLNNANPIPQIGVFFPQEAANDPVYNSIPTQSMQWPDGIDYKDPNSQNDIEMEEIVIGGTDGDLALREQERENIREAISAAKRAEESETIVTNKSFFGRIKRWFGGESQDDRTLEERLAELDGHKDHQTVEQQVVRDFSGEKIKVDPALIEEVTLDETTLPKGSLGDRDRFEMKALQDVARLHEADTAVLAAKKSLWGRMKGWLTGSRQDNRTLEERLAETGDNRTLDNLRRKLALHPTSLTQEEVLTLTDREREYYLHRLSMIEVEKRAHLRDTEHTLSKDPSLLTKAEIDLLNPNQKAYYDGWVEQHKNEQKK